VAAAFAKGKPASYIGGGAVRRVMVYCSDGIYVPPSTAVVPPPVHIDAGSDEDKTPVGATP
jgi:hypothetical protein